MSTFVYRPTHSPIRPDRIWQEVLLRLRWSIPGPVEDISIDIGLNQDGTEELQPFISHPLAMENIAIPPARRLSIGCQDIGEGKHFYLISDDYTIEPLIIENADQSPITIKDFVVRTHNYLSQHKDMLINCGKFKFRGPPPPGEIVGPEYKVSYYTPGQHDLLFKSATSTSLPDGVVVNVKTFLEGELESLLWSSGTVKGR